MTARMVRYVLEQRESGTEVTGADLDKHFGTKDYGRKILRKLASTSTGV